MTRASRTGETLIGDGSIGVGSSGSNPATVGRRAPTCLLVAGANSSPILAYRRALAEVVLRPTAGRGFGQYGDVTPAPQTVSVGSRPSKEHRMTQQPIDVVRAILSNPTDPDLVGRLVAPDASYVSLNYDNPELKKLMPWCGIGHGPKGIVDTFVKVRRFWRTDAFEVRAMFASGEDVAVFGSFTYTSTKVGRTVTSPFAILAKVADGRLTYMQFMEDTFATSMSFRTKGVWHFESDPDGGEVTVGAEEA